MSAPEIRNTLVLSTAHLSPETLANFPLKAVVGGEYSDYGWFFYSEHGPEPELPPELKAIIYHAQKHKCEFVLLDRDGDIDPNLPVFEH